MEAVSRSKGLAISLLFGSTMAAPPEKVATTLLSRLSKATPAGPPASASGAGGQTASQPAQPPSDAAAVVPAAQAPQQAGTGAAAAAGAPPTVGQILDATMAQVQVGSGADQGRTSNAEMAAMRRLILQLESRIRTLEIVVLSTFRMPANHPAGSGNRLRRVLPGRGRLSRGPRPGCAAPNPGRGFAL